MDSTSPSLLLRLRDRADHDAWNRFVQLYTPLLAHWGRRAGLADSDLRDLIQEVFTLLLARLPEFQYDDRQSFRGWLRTVTLNKWRELGRRRRLEPVAPEAKLWQELSAAATDEFWEQEYNAFLVARAMQLMRQHFSPQTWRACLATVMDGRSAADVAAELKISEASVYQARSRVLRRLRDELSDLLE